MKSKFVNKTICKMVLTGLLFNTLPVSLSMKGAAPSSPTASTKKIVDQEIKQIRDTVRKLNRLKLYISGITAGVGILATLGIAGVSIVALRYGRKLIAEFQKQMNPIKKALLEKTKHVEKLINEFSKSLPDIEVVGQGTPKERLQKAMEFKNKIRDFIKTYFPDDHLMLIKKLKKKIDTVTEFIGFQGTKKRDIVLKKYGLFRLTYANVDIEHALLTQENKKFFKELAQQKKIITQSIKSKLKAKRLFYYPKTLVAAGLGGLFIALLTASGTLGGIIGSLIGLKRVQAAEAFFGALKLEKLEEKNPGTLTTAQKNDIAQLKKLSNNWMVRGYIKGLIIKGIMKRAIDELIKQYPQQVAALGKEKQARKTLSKYIKLRWKAENLQKLLAQEKEHARLMGELLTPDWIKIYKKARASLPKIERKISALEGQHHGLRALAKDVAHRYTTVVNDMLNKLEKTATIQKIAALPVISL